MLNRSLAVALLTAVLSAVPVRADAFDLYTNPILAKVPGADGVQEIKQATPAVLGEHDRVLPDAVGALLVVRTNDNRWSKLLLRFAFRKVDADRRIPMLLIERFITYKEGDERAVQAEGRNVNLFAGFRFNLDIGQVVPEELGGDLRYVVEDGKPRLEALGKARLYLLAKPMPAAAPRGTAKLQVGETFERRYFNGTYKLYVDGRRSGKLTLKVEDDGEVTGAFYSDKDGSKYEVHGKVGMPSHSIQFTVRLPRAEESFQGFLFTGDGKALAGSSKLLDREAGFYALRIEEE
jgi:hypothetical protein